MVQLVKAVVLDSFKFKETSLICNLYSQDFGLMSVIVSGMGKSKSIGGQIYFQPLSVIEFSVNYKEKKGILRATNICLVYSPIGIIPDVKKYAISFFIAELILKTCREKEQDPELYALLESTILLLGKEDFYDLHLYFLVKYIHLLGFSMRDNEFLSHDAIDHSHTKKVKDTLIQLSLADSYLPMLVNKAERLIIIKYILHFLESNIGQIKLKSLSVLEDIFV